KGPRRFDSEKQGRAAETEWTRAASNESRPGPIDLSSPGANGPREAPTGQGPGTSAGVVNRPATGPAPTAPGTAPDPNANTGENAAVSEVQRAYARYELEIRRRVSSVLVFPRKLALRLEQGETIVQFVVRMDGRLAGGVQVLKSAGFDEFDAEAVRAV